MNSILYRIATVLSHVPSKMPCVPEVPIYPPCAEIQSINCAGQDPFCAESAHSAEGAESAGGAEYLDFGTCAVKMSAQGAGHAQGAEGAGLFLTCDFTMSLSCVLTVVSSSTSC